MDRQTVRSLEGVRVLVVDDEFLIALDVSAILTDAGAAVVGPYHDLECAMAVAERNALDAGVLDVRLGNDTSERIATALSSRGIPYLFYSGQPIPSMLHGTDGLPPPLLAKPASAATLVAAVVELLGRSRRPEPMASSPT